MPGLTRLEIKVLVTVLSNNEDSAVRDLFRIIPNLVVAERKYTGVGFFTKFAEDKSLQMIDLDETYLSKHPPEAVGFHPRLKGLVNFLVWVKNGQIDSLEAASTDRWPDDETQFVVSTIPDRSGS